MKKAWRKLCRQELLLDFVKFALLICVAGGFLAFLIKKIMDKPTIPAWDVHLAGLSAAVIFIIILLAGVSFYRLSASYIRWYGHILDSVPMPVIITGKDARVQMVNKAAMEIICGEQKSSVENLNCRHLIGADGGVMERLWANNGIEYRVYGGRLDNGYLIFLDKPHCVPDSHKTRAGLIDEINRLMGRLSTATNKFHSCASGIAGCSVLQAGIISDLTDVIAGIAAGEYQEPTELNEKIFDVKTNMKRHMETSQVHLENVRRAVNELDATRSSINGALHEIDSVL